MLRILVLEDNSDRQNAFIRRYPQAVMVSTALECIELLMQDWEYVYLDSACGSGNLCDSERGDSAMLVVRHIVEHRPRHLRLTQFVVHSAHMRYAVSMVHDLSVAGHRATVRSFIGLLPELAVVSPDPNSWQRVSDDDLSSPENYVWYCRRARDIVSSINSSIKLESGLDLPVAQDFWQFEDRNPDEDPDWDDSRESWIQLHSDISGESRELALRRCHKRWRHDPVIDGVDKAVDTAMKEVMRQSGIDPNWSNTVDSWDLMPTILFLWGPQGCGKTALAKTIGWIMRNFVDKNYQLLTRTFTVPEESFDIGLQMFCSVLDEIRSLSRCVILLDDFVESLPSPELGPGAGQLRREIVKELGYWACRKDDLRNQMRQNKSILIISSRSAKEIGSDLFVGPNYRLRPPQTDDEVAALQLVAK